ncbi:lysophospholipase [Cohnella sp.]|uniref:alpha/beta hydrolase n=1 Tax=Cohnella sp. TaxID=1883426 RepID=UPI00356A10A3
MNYTEFEGRSSDGTRMFGCSWKPIGERQVKAAIGIVHGMGEHTGLYIHVAQTLTAAGYAVFALDQRGHGRTGGKRGDIPIYDTLLEGVDFLLAEVDRRYPNLPRFLYGHSMGGNVTINYLLRRKSKLDGAIVTGPWLKLAFKRLPNRLAERIAERMRLGSRSSAAEQAILAPETIRGNAKDSLSHTKITLRFFINVQWAGWRALAQARELTVPVLLLHGSNDEVTSIKGSRLFAERACTLCTFQEWPGCRHELHNEPGRDDVLASVLQWLNESELRQSRQSQTLQQQMQHKMKMHRNQPQ